MARTNSNDHDGLRGRRGPLRRITGRALVGTGNCVFALCVSIRTIIPAEQIPSFWLLAMIMTAAAIAPIYSTLALSAAAVLTVLLYIFADQLERTELVIERLSALLPADQRETYAQDFYAVAHDLYHADFRVLLRRSARSRLRALRIDLLLHAPSTVVGAWARRFARRSSAPARPQP